MTGTLIEQVLGRLVKRTVVPGEIITVEPHRVLSHDNSAFIIKKFLSTGYKDVWNREKIVIAFDHCVPAVNAAHQQNHDEAKKFVNDFHLPNFFDAGEGICHQLMMENGFVLPGELVIGADSHSTIYGALNAVGIPVNRTEMAGIWATGTIWLKVPQSIRIELTGRLRPGTYAKDLCLKLLRDLSADGATYRSLEYAGDGVRSLSISERMTITNMAVELGAKNGIMPFDDVTRKYLTRCGRSEFEPVTATANAKYESSLSVDLTELQPQISCPDTVDNVDDLSAVIGTPVHQGYLGSCTNGRLDDLRIAARIMDGKKIAKGVRLAVYPASRTIAEAAEKEGLFNKIRDAGGTIMSASCGPCFGAVGATLQAGEVCISSSNRNFRGRMGSPESAVYLSSPAVVAASCLAGHIADPGEYLQ